jgi:hypothetical protein
MPKKDQPKGMKKILMDRTRSKGIFNTALKASRFDPKNPGMVDVYLRVYIYNPITKAREILPGKTIELSAASIEDVDDMLNVIRAALQDWIAGLPVRRYNGDDTGTEGLDVADEV